jgi:hypothetical protein
LCGVIVALHLSLLFLDCLVSDMVSEDAKGGVKPLLFLKYLVKRA